MISRFRGSFGDLPISTKLNIVQSITLLVLFIIAITWLSEWTTQRAVKSQTETIQQASRQTMSMIQLFNETLVDHAVRMGETLKRSLPSGYTLDTTQRINVAGTPTPVLKAGNDVLNLNFDEIDRFSVTNGSVGSIFVRDGNEFVRITTSLKKENGERAIGTKLDHEHPAYATLIANKPYTGKAELFGRQFMTHYLPMQDASGTIVGAIFTGHDFTKEMNALRQSILGTRFGKNGYMYVIDAGKNAGTLIAHPTIEGKNMYDDKDAKGFYYVRAMIEQKEGVLPYWFINTAIGETKARKRIAIFDTVPQWDWIIVSSLDGKDLDENAADIRNQLIVGAVVLGALLFIAIFVASRRWVTRPLTEAVSAMEKIAEGQLTIAIPAHGKDEVGRLLEATNTMAGNIRSAMSDIQIASQQLTQNAEHLVKTAQDSADQSVQQSDSAAAMATGIEEMNANIVQVSNGARQAHQVSLDSDNISNEGAAIIQQATESMTRIA
ncbi:MAG: methyl-accepting chemotaxis protein, partial [Betaproteobacteria bacterium]|nr:methyl-accepting chemotaxis protein [Betaproteobacteria bacterium]